MMTKMTPVADQEMVKAALGEDGYDELAEPPNAEMPWTHPLCAKIVSAIKEVYDFVNELIRENYLKIYDKTRK